MKKMRILAVLLVSALFLAGLLSACSNEKKLVGTWVAEDDDSSSITFASDGSGTVRESGLNGDITWSAEGNKLTITISMCGSSETSEYRYSVNGKTLTLTGIDDPDDVTVFKKQGTQ